MDRSAKALLFRLGRLPEDYREGVRQAAAIADQDPGMGLARCRATLEKFVGGLYAAHVAAPSPKDTLDGMVARLARDGHLPEPLATCAGTVRLLGNYGVHRHGVRFTPADVRRALDLLLAVLDWHFGGILPDAGAFDLPTPDGGAYARHLVRRQGPAAAEFTPLFLRPDGRAAPPVGVAPARLLVGGRGPLDMPDGAEAPPGPDARPLTEVADGHPLRVLRGEPGAGKTTACAFLAVRAAEAFLAGPTAEGPRPLPVLVELRRFAPRDGEAPADALARLVAAALKEGGALPASYAPDDADARPWLAEAGDTRPLALYLDGLNEVGPARRDDVIDALAGLLAQLHGTPSRVDFVGLGRMVLAYPEFPADVLAGRPLARKRLCRTFSDCTTAPRNGLVSGCYPLDPFYKARPEMVELTRVKQGE